MAPGPEVAILRGAGVCARAHVFPRSRACVQPRMRAHACLRALACAHLPARGQSRGPGSRGARLGKANAARKPASSGRTETAGGSEVKSQTSKKERKRCLRRGAVGSPRPCPVLRAPRPRSLCGFAPALVAPARGVRGARPSGVRGTHRALRCFVTASTPAGPRSPPHTASAAARASSALRGPLSGTGRTPPPGPLRRRGHSPPLGAQGSA